MTVFSIPFQRHLRSCIQNSCCPPNISSLQIPGDVNFFANHLAIPTVQFTSTAARTLEVRHSMFHRHPAQQATGAECLSLSAACAVWPLPLIGLLSGRERAIPAQGAVVVIENQNCPELNTVAENKNICNALVNIHPVNILCVACASS